MTIRIFRDDDKLVKDLDQSPTQFQGVLSTVYAGTSIETLAEGVYPTNQLMALPIVEHDDLSSEWRVAFGITKAGSKPVSGSSRPYHPVCDGVSRGGGTRRPRSREDRDDWRREYREALAGIWQGWAFAFSPLVAFWLPFMIGATLVWSAAALVSYIEERLSA